MSRLTDTQRMHALRPRAPGDALRAEYSANAGKVALCVMLWILFFITLVTA